MAFHDFAKKSTRPSTPANDMENGQTHVSQKSNHVRVNMKII